MRKAQVAIEFIALMGIALLIFAAYVPIAWSREKFVREEREDILAWRIVVQAKKEINLATSFGAGYSRNFTLPNFIMSSPYNMTVDNQSLIIIISWKQKQITDQIITPNITEGPKPGTNRITNDNGVIEFD